MPNHICGCGGVGRSLTLSQENCCSVMTSQRGRALSGLRTAPYMDSYIIWAASSLRISQEVGEKDISYIAVKISKRETPTQVFAYVEYVAGTSERC